jgi:hypothetical protein
MVESSAGAGVYLSSDIDLDVRLKVKNKQRRPSPRTFRFVLTLLPPTLNLASSRLLHRSWG